MVAADIGAMMHPCRRCSACCGATGAACSGRSCGDRSCAREIAPGAAPIFSLFFGTRRDLSRHRILPELRRDARIARRDRPGRRARSLPRQDRVRSGRRRCFRRCTCAAASGRASRCGRRLSRCPGLDRIATIPRAAAVLGRRVGAAQIQRHQLLAAAPRRAVPADHARQAEPLRPPKSTVTPATTRTRSSCNLDCGFTLDGELFTPTPARRSYCAAATRASFLRQDA